MKRVSMLLCLGVLMLWTSLASAATPLGGLAVAISPAGDILTAAGDSRTLYVIDAAKMEVTKRVWLGVCIVDLQFSKNGGFLLAEDTDGTLHQIDTKTWQVAKTMPKAQQMAASRAADLIAGLNADYNGHVVRFFSMTDMSEKGKIAFPKEQKVIALGVDAAGGRLAVLMESVNDASEPKNATVPPELKGIQADDFRIKNDGKTSLFMVFKVPSGEKIAEHKIYYSPSSSGWKMLFQGDNVLALNYSNLNAKIDPKGEVTVFNLANSYNYGIGMSADQAVILSGGLSLAAYTKAGDLSAGKVEPDRLPGWPEYFRGFSVAGDGTAYGSTSSYRIIKMKAGGAFEKSYPVY